MSDFNPLADAAIPGITEQDDGSAIVDMPEEAEAPAGAHGDNLATTLTVFELNTLASELVDLIDKDKEARSERDKQQEEGIRRTGLGDDAPGGATFDGASKVVHPVLVEGCVDFSARAIKELFPANGPVRTKIYGAQDEAHLQKAKKKRDFLNWYTTVKMPEYRSEKEILLTQLPLGGSQYEKYWYDSAKKRVCMEFVPIDRVLLPYSAPSFYDTPRLTHMQDRTEAQIERYVDSGFYKDVFTISSQTVEETASQEATNKIEGKEQSGYNEDGIRLIYEVTCVREIGGEYGSFVVHIDEPTQRIAAIYRNWAEQDPNQEALQWWVEDKFIPWRGIYGIGLHHLIGGMAASLTGSLRALLDSAHINNSPSAIKLKGGRASGQNINLDVCSITEMDAPAGIDDIRKAVMPIPFNPPSPVLFQLLDWITAQAKGVVATAEEKIADAGNNMPVGTTLALIEQGSQVFSSIHSRLHEAQRRALKIICRLIAEHGQDHAADLQRFGLTPQDFLSADDVEPVSDPNIFSETQRFAQMQAVMQLQAADAPDPSINWNKLALRRRMLDLLRVDGADELLPKPPQPVTADPVQENLACMNGLPLKANLVQDHLSHIKTHLMFILQPLVAEGPLGSGPQMSALMQHIQEHLVLAYQHTTQAAMMLIQSRAPGISPDMAAAEAAMMAQESMSKLGQGLLPMLTEAQQIVAKKTPPPPMDPAVKATYDATMAEVNRKAKRDDAEMKLKQDEQLATLREQAQSLQAEAAQRQQDFAKELSMFREELSMQQRELDNKREADLAKVFVELLKLEQANASLQQDAVTREQEFSAKLSEVQNANAAPQAPDLTPHIQQLGDMLGQLKEARQNDQMNALMEGMHGVLAHLAAPSQATKGPDGSWITRKVLNNGE